MGGVSTRSSSRSTYSPTRVTITKNCGFLGEGQTSRKTNRPCAPGGRARNGTKKCYKAGKVTRNPFFNFLREYRAKNCGQSIIALAKAAGAQWRKMDEKQREPYCKMAHAAPKTVRRRRHHRCEHHKAKRRKCR